MNKRKSLLATATFFMLTGSAMAQQKNAESQTNDAAVRAVSSGFVESWNRHDMKSFAALYADDADFVNVIGSWWRGRAEIQKAHEAIHAARMKNSHLVVDETAVRFLRPDVAIVRARWTLTGTVGPDGTPLPVRKGLLMHVMARTGKTWLIAASQNTDTLPALNAPIEK